MTQNIKSVDELKEKIKETQSFKFKIKVVANSKNNSVDFEEEFIKIKIKERAIEGKANKAIIEFLSDTLRHPKSKIKILNGEKSAIKTIQISN